MRVHVRYGSISVEEACVMSICTLASSNRHVCIHVRLLGVLLLHTYCAQTFKLDATMV